MMRWADMEKKEGNIKIDTEMSEEGEGNRGLLDFRIDLPSVAPHGTRTIST
jgi:hypothetical protein